MPDLPDIPELPEDIPDEFRPLMKGLGSRPSARSTPHRGIQLPQLNNPNAASAAARTNGKGPPISARMSNATTQRVPAVRSNPGPGQNIKPPSGTGFVKPSSTVIAGAVKPPSGTSPAYPRPASSSGFTPQPVILSNDSSKPTSGYSPRATPARGNPAITLTPVPTPGVSGRMPLQKPVGPPAHPGSRSSQKMGWVCHRCHCRVDPEAIVRNEAVMIDGLPLCGRCVKESQSNKFNKTLQVFGALGLVVGIVACLVIFCKTSLLSHKDSQALEQAKDVQAVAESGNISEAEQRVSALMSGIESGVCKDPDVISTAYKAEATIKQRVKSLYGELSPKEHELLDFTLGSYPGEPKHERVRAVHVDDDSNVATITMAFSQSAAQDNFKTEVRAVTVALLQRFPKIASITMTIQFFTNGDNLADAGTFSLDRAAAAATVKTGAPIYPGAPGTAEQSGNPVRMVNPIAPLPPAISATPAFKGPPEAAKIAPPQTPLPDKPQAPAGPAALPSGPGVFDPSKAPALQQH